MIRLQVPSLDSRIDEIYRTPLKDFVAARQALAKALAGDERQKVSALQKPLALPWLVNQTYWQARRTYDKLLAAGEKLRAAQVGALKGKSTDVRGAVARHAEAVMEAVGEATRIAESAGLTVAPDALRRMFEAISTRDSLPARHGRFVKPIEPAGFEALAGIAIAPPLREPAPPNDRRQKEAERQRQEERVDAARRRQLAIRDAEKRAARAVDAERRARAAWEETRQEVAEADRALADLLASPD